MELVPRPPITTAASTKQSIAQRCSQADAANDGQYHRGIVDQPMELRRSSADFGHEEIPNGLSELTRLDMNDNQQHKHEQSHEDLAHGPSGAEKGTEAMSDGQFETIVRDQSMKVVITKKRKAPCARSRIAQAVVAGAATVTVASGIALCRVYPSSSAATWIQVAADEVQHRLYLLFADLLSEGRMIVDQLSDVVYIAWLTLLKHEQMTNAARVLTFVVDETVKLQITALLRMTHDFLHPFAAAVTELMGAFNLPMKWVQSFVRNVLKLREKDGVRNRVQSFLVITFLSLADSLGQVGEWMRSSMEHTLAWTGLTSNVSDVRLPKEELLALLTTTEVAIENIERKLTAHELQAFQNVKRFEKRRVTIAFDTKAILAETRNRALESISNVKMAALKTVEYRLKHLEEQYAQTFGQVLQHYEQTSWEIKSEGGAAILDEIAEENQAFIDAAVALKLALTHDQYSDNEEQTETPVTEDGGQMSAESRYDCATDEQCLEGEREDRVLDGLFNSPELIEVGQSVTEVVNEELMPIDLPELPVTKRSVSDETLISDPMDKEQTQLSNQLPAELSGIVGIEFSTLKESTGYLSKDHVQVVTERLEDDKVTLDLESLKNKVVAGKRKESPFTEVLLDLDNAMLKVNHFQVKVTELVDVRNLSDEVERIEQEGHDTSLLDITADQTDLKLDVDIGQGETDQMQVGGAFFDVPAHVADPPGLKGIGDIEAQKIDMTEYTHANEYIQVLTETLSGDNMVQREDMNAEIAPKMTTGGVKINAVIAETKRVQDTNLLGLPNSVEAAADQETLDRDGRSVNEAQRGDEQLLQDAYAAISTELETLELESVAVVKEVLGLEQRLLPEDSERARIENELRSIAEEEEIWLDLMHQQKMFEQRSTATIDVPKTAEMELKKNLQPSELPWSQIGLLSIMFLGLVALAGYLPVQSRKARVLAQTRRRRARWKSLADVDEAEEVVLLSDDQSDYDDDRDALVDVDEEIDAEEKRIEAQEVVDKDEEHDRKKSYTEPLTLETVAEFTPTAYMTDSTATPSPDASSFRTTESVSTPVALSPEAPSISQRTRQRRRQIRM